MPVFRFIEIRCHFQNFLFAEGLNLHVDEILLNLLGDIVDDEDDIAILQTLLVKIQL